MKLINSPLNSIDYDNHPGFVAYRRAKRSGPSKSSLSDINKELYQIIESIDKTYQDYVGSRREGEESDKAFVETLRSQLMSVKSLCEPCFESESMIARSFETAMEFLYRLLMEESLVWKTLKKNSFDSSRFAAGALQVKQELETEGVVLRNIPKEYIDALWNYTQPVRARLASIRINEPPSRSCNISIGFDKPHGSLILEIMREVQFIDGLQAFYNCEVEPLYCAGHMCHPEEQWFKDCYQDVGLETARLAYAHYDSGFEVCKAVIYLNQVSPEQGPFTYVPKSRIPQASPFLLGLSKCLPKAFKQTIDPDVKKQAGHYYRAVFKLPQLRKEFIQLPTVLRLASHFGDDVVDGGLLSDQLAAAEQTVTSDKGNCMIFDGDKVIHRGGWVHSGDRWVLNIGFRIKQFAGIFQQL